MKNRKIRLTTVVFMLLLMVFVIYGVISSNMNFNDGSSFTDQYQSAENVSDPSINSYSDSSKEGVLEDESDLLEDDSVLSIKGILNENNEELLKMIDIRKIVVFAIYGIDDKTTEEGRSDIIMVVKYDPSLKKMVMVSLPRDLRVDVPGYGLTKINHAYAYGGSELIDQVIEELLGIKLDFSIKLNFNTFSKIIDDVGGVRINAQKPFYDGNDELVINEGQQVLDGKNALFYVRFRSDSDGDYGRIARQQEVVIALMEYLKSTSLKAKIKLVETYYHKGIETDAKLTKMIDYIKMSRDDENITYENYRLQTYSVIIDELWYEIYNQEDLDSIKLLFDKKEEMNLENWN